MPVADQRCGAARARVLARIVREWDAGRTGDGIASWQALEAVEPELPGRDDRGSIRDAAGRDGPRQRLSNAVISAPAVRNTTRGTVDSWTWTYFLPLPFGVAFGVALGVAFGVGVC
jgi:hypothetical protein